ncbi:MAG: HIT family protein, partial [Promethearchaeota archaeon]
EDELAETIKVVKKISMNIHQNLEIDGYNILQNNFSAAGQVVKHFHMHIIPRRNDDGKFRLKIPRYQANDEELNEIHKHLKLE